MPSKPPAGIGQGVLAFIGSIALGLLVLEWLLSGIFAPSDWGLPNYLLLLAIVVVTVPLVVGLYRKFRVWMPALIGGIVGTALAVFVIAAILVFAFLGYILTGSP